MRVLGLRWLGIRATAYTPMVQLLRDRLGLHVEFERETTIELSLPGGERVQLFAPGDPYFEFFGRHATGPVPLFEVDDIRDAREELEGAGVAVISQLEADKEWEWLHFRGPDGNLYELASRRKA